MTARRPLVVVADDDDDIISFVEINLRMEDFDVVTATDGEQALQMAYERTPDLMLLDVMMPKLDGFEVCQRLRKDPRTMNISVIMLTAKSLSADKVVGLTAGADDYMIKPFDPVELVARVKSTLRRTREMRDVNPLTQLPGNVQIQEEVAQQVESGAPFAVVYIDVDNFKPFNDHYGFLRGDEAIKLLSKCIYQSIGDDVQEAAFVGHVGGDDFIVIVDGDAAETTAKKIIDCWDQNIASLYDAADLARGYIEVQDRRQEVHRFPLLSVSIGIATNAHRPIDSRWEAAEIATEMKQFAKQERGSTYAIDRRR